MGRVVLQAGISVDGLVLYPPGEEHEQMVEWKVRSVCEASVHVMGRVTYEEMAAHWPTSGSSFAAPMNDVSKASTASSCGRSSPATVRVCGGSVTWLNHSPCRSSTPPTSLTAPAYAATDRPNRLLT